MPAFPAFTLRPKQQIREMMVRKQIIGQVEVLPGKLHSTCTPVNHMPHKFHREGHYSSSEVRAWHEDEENAESDRSSSEDEEGHCRARPEQLPNERLPNT
jgi:hypothetical protein